MAITYEDVIPSLIENTTLQKRLYDGVHRQYLIKAADGYLLHDNRLDWEDFDPETYEPVFKLGYTRGEKTCAATYDFEANPYEFYTAPDNGEIPDNQIFGGVNNDHEIM